MQLSSGLFTICHMQRLERGYLCGIKDEDTILRHIELSLLDKNTRTTMKLLMTLMLMAVALSAATAGYIRNGWSSPVVYSSYPSYSGWTGGSGWTRGGGWNGGGWNGGGWNGGGWNGGGWNRGWNNGWNSGWW
ncbi:unnamed protein product [Euphydryas editha]|uniref:Uncharacterized protein n=1 Tax=Euphydryas editha TaxID=104508 RepID=A0AAU9TSW6_EUPED|nr:unnamed protein product [Euphydryas editha]